MTKHKVHARHTNDPRRQRWMRQLLEEWRQDVVGTGLRELRAEILLRHMTDAAGLYMPEDQDTRDALYDVLDKGEIGTNRRAITVVGKVACAGCYRSHEPIFLTADYMCSACTAERKTPL